MKLKMAWTTSLEEEEDEDWEDAPEEIQPIEDDAKANGWRRN